MNIRVYCHVYIHLFTYMHTLPACDDFSISGASGGDIN
jgi:hypothetical protein